MRLPGQEPSTRNREIGVLETMKIGAWVLLSSWFSPEETAPKEKPGIANQIQVMFSQFHGLIQEINKQLSEKKELPIINEDDSRAGELAIQTIIQTIEQITTNNPTAEAEALELLKGITRTELEKRLVEKFIQTYNSHDVIIKFPSVVALTIYFAVYPNIEKLNQVAEPAEPTLSSLPKLTLNMDTVIKSYFSSREQTVQAPESKLDSDSDSDSDSSTEETSPLLSEQKRHPMNNQQQIAMTPVKIITLFGALWIALASAMRFIGAKHEANKTTEANATNNNNSTSEVREPSAFPPTSSIPVEPTTASTTSSSRGVQLIGILKRSPSSTPNKKAAASTQKKIAAVASQQQELLLLHDNMQIFPIFFLRNLMSATAPTLLLPRMTRQHSANRSQRSTTTLPSYVNHNAQSQEQLKQSTTLPLLLMDKPADESATQNEPTVFMPISAENAVRLFLLNSQIQQNLLQPSGIIAPRHSVMSNERTTAANGGPEITINTTVLPTSQSFDATSIDPKNKKQKRNNKNKKIKNEKQLAVAQLKAQQEEQLFDKKLAAIVSELAERQTTLETEKNKKRKLKKVQQEKKERKKLATKRKKLAAEFVDNLLAPFLDDSKTQQAQQDTNNIEQNITDTMKIVHTLSASRSATLTDQQKEKIDDVTRQITEFDQEVQNADGDHHAPTEASRGEQRMVGSPSTVSADSSLDSKYNAAQQTVNQDYPEGSSRFERPVFWSIPRDRLNSQAPFVHSNRSVSPEEHHQETAANAGPTVSATTKTIKRSNSAHDLMQQNTKPTITVMKRSNSGNFDAAERSFNIPVQRLQTQQENQTQLSIETTTITAVHDIVNPIVDSTVIPGTSSITNTVTQQQSTVAANPVVPNDRSNNESMPVVNGREAVTAGSKVSATIVTDSSSTAPEINKQRNAHRADYAALLFFDKEGFDSPHARKQACADMPFFMEPTDIIIKAKETAMLADKQSEKYKQNNDPTGKLLFQLEAVEKNLIYLNEIYKERSARAHRCHGIGRLFCIFNLQAEYKTTFNKKAEAEKMLTEINRLRSVLEKTSSTATIWTAGAASCQDKNSRLNLLGDKLRYLQKEITSLQNNAAASVSVARAGQLH